jgi:heme exporter protein A
MTTPAHLLEARGLACLRGECQLFEGLSFGVSPGEALQVEGANGSGKTSLLRILAGLLPPAEGEVVWEGERISGSQRARYLGGLAYLGHNLGLKADLTVLENLRMAAALAGRVGTQSDLRFALDQLGLEDRAELAVRVLSAGQRQRVAMARLLISGARLWILDEPFTALDAAAVSQVVSLLENHLAQAGLAVLTSHQPVALSRGLRSLVLG